MKRPDMTLAPEAPPEPEPDEHATPNTLPEEEELDD